MVPYLHWAISSPLGILSSLFLRLSNYCSGSILSIVRSDVEGHPKVKSSLRWWKPAVMSSSTVLISLVTYPGHLVSSKFSFGFWVQQ